MRVTKKDVLNDSHYLQGRQLLTAGSAVSQLYQLERFLMECISTCSQPRMSDMMICTVSLLSKMGSAKRNRGVVISAEKRRSYAIIGLTNS